MAVYQMYLHCHLMLLQLTTIENVAILLMEMSHCLQEARKIRYNANTSACSVHSDGLVDHCRVDD